MTEMQEYKTDDFLLKFLHPNKNGVMMEIYMRRRKRYPKTLSLYPEPVLSISLDDLVDAETGDSKMKMLFKTLIDKSQNANSYLLSHKKSDRPDFDEELEELEE